MNDGSSQTGTVHSLPLAHWRARICSLVSLALTGSSVQGAPCFCLAVKSATCRFFTILASTKRGDDEDGDEKLYEESWYTDGIPATGNKSKRVLKMVLVKGCEKRECFIAPPGHCAR